MKKLKLTALILVLGLSAALFTGCADRNDDRTDALEDKIDRLEDEVADLKKEKSTDTANSSTDSNTDSSEETLDTLTNAVNDAVAKAEAASATGTDEENKNSYLGLKEELDGVDHRLDAFDDSIEIQYKNGTLTREEYRSQEQGLESLENTLDGAEDKLEWTFGIND